MTGPGTPVSPASIEVFYSYAHEDEELVKELRKHLSILKRQGVIREWYDREITAGTDWKGQLDQHLNSSGVILLLVSAAFLASDYCYDVEMTRALERHDQGEAHVIPVLLRKVDGWQDAPFGKLQSLPTDGKPVTSWKICDEAFADVARGIRNAIGQLRAHIVQDLNLGTGPSIAGLSWPEPPASLLWPMADHGGVREAFARLLAPDATWRFLPILGPTETGKSHITKQMLANALQIPELACGRFDFKGTTNMDREVRAFVQFLGVPLPPADLQLNERLGDILDALKQRARPAFLVFDTYEVAGEAQDWVERQLLPSLIRATWLRVVIAGQRVPEVAGAVWASAARAPLQLVPPPPADWFEYGKQYRPDLTLADVESVCRLTNKASVLKQLLVPTT